MSVFSTFSWRRLGVGTTTPGASIGDALILALHFRRGKLGQDVSAVVGENGYVVQPDAIEPNFWG